jgi:hypothetical protein
MHGTASELADALHERYLIERELGRGGMATVYLAEDLKHHREVAVEVVRAELAATLGPERFLREIEISARLQACCAAPGLPTGQPERHGDSGGGTMTARH